MNYRIFASQIEVVHRKWTGETFHIPQPEKTGIDLADDEIGIEIKCRLEIYANSYAVHAYQITQFEEENKNKELFWGFMKYGMSKAVKRIVKKDNLSELVTGREIIFVPWNWIKKFPVFKPKTGPYVYAHAKDFPARDEMVRYDFPGAVAFLPKNSLLEEKLNSPKMIEKYLRLKGENQVF